MSEPTLLSLEPRRTALLSMDIQTALVAIYGKDSSEFLPGVSSVLTHGRAVGARVLHVRVGFRPGFPEVSERNRLLSAMKANPQHRQIFEGAWGEIHSAVAPLAEEIVITKRRISAFHGTDLSVVLRAQEVDTLVLFGISTSGVVLSTALEAIDLDFRVVVVRDCCLDSDLALHACLLDRLLPQRATVTTATELIESLN